MGLEWPPAQPPSGSANRRDWISLWPASKLKAEITYFENQRDRMDYVRYQALGSPIGSGIVEAACKTLATQRLKRSGTSWGDGKQAMLTFRSLRQSDRWPRGWPLVAATFKRPVAVLAKKGHLSRIVLLDKAA